MSADTPPATGAAPPSPWRRWLDFALAEFGPLAGLLLVFAFFAAADALFGAGSFLTPRNIRVILSNLSIVSVAALGMTIIIIAGGIDLSAGTAITLSATVLAVLLKIGIPEWVAVGSAVGTGVLCGALNGALVISLRVVPFIVTLGTMTIFLGVGKLLAGESTVYPDQDHISPWLGSLCSTRPPHLLDYTLPTPVGSLYVYHLSIPSGVLLLLLMAAAVAAVMRLTVFGRHVFAIGSSEATARLCGVNIPLTKIAVYTLAGVFVGLAGMYHFSLVKMGNPVEGIGLELQVIAAVVIGGGSLSGGRGSVLGTLTGAGIMAVQKSGCDQLGVSDPLQNAIIGGIIIAAVAIDRLRQWLTRTGGEE